MSGVFSARSFSAGDLNPAFGGDGLHLNPAGYQRMADAVDLALFAQ